MQRERFLSRVGGALRAAQLPELGRPVASPSIGFDDLVTKFVEEAAAVDAGVVRVTGIGDALAAVVRIMDRERSFIAWDGLEDILPGWEDCVSRHGWQRVAATVSERRHEDLDRIGAVAVGVTGADCGIAASGSVLLMHGPGRPRAASLLVDTHIVILPSEHIVASLQDAMQMISWERTSNVAVITGPSRTGDIDSVLTLGVHGPRHLHIVVVE